MTEEKLKERFKEFFKISSKSFYTLRRAETYIKLDPQSSLTKTRIVLEIVVKNLYNLLMEKTPKHKMVGQYLNDLEFTRRIEQSILSKIDSVRKLGNMGPHDTYSIKSSIAYEALTVMYEIIDWVQSNYLINNNAISSPNTVDYWESIIPDKYASLGKFVNKFKHISDLFVEPTNFNTIKEMLDKNELLIILGPAHIGKTTLALYLCHFLTKNKIVNDFIIYPRDGRLGDLNDFRDSIIFFDDPFGGSSYKSNNSEIGEDFSWLIDMCRTNSNYAIITSRTEIFNQALHDTKLSESKFINNIIIELKLTDYSYTKRKEMLFRHLNNNILSKELETTINENLNVIIETLIFPHSYYVFSNIGVKKIDEGTLTLNEALKEANEIELVVGKWFMDFEKSQKEIFYLLFTLVLFQENTDDIIFDLYYRLINKLKITRGINLLYQNKYDINRIILTTSPYINYNYKMYFDHPSYRQGIFSKIKEYYLGDLYNFILICDELISYNDSTYRLLGNECLDEIGMFFPDETIEILKKAILNDWRCENYNINSLLKLGEKIPQKVLPLCFELLASSNSYIKSDSKKVIRVLCALAPKDYLPIIYDLINEKDINIAYDAISCLEQVLCSDFDDVWPLYKKFFEHEESTIRRAGVISCRYALKTQDKLILPYLNRLEKDENWFVRKAVEFVLDSFYRKQLI